MAPNSTSSKPKENGCYRAAYCATTTQCKYLYITWIGDEHGCAFWRHQNCIQIVDQRYQFLC